MVNLAAFTGSINDLLLPCGGDQVSIDPALPDYPAGRQRTLSQPGSVHHQFAGALRRHSLRAQRERLECWEGAEIATLHPHP
jgi:alpha-mannosidase